MKTLLNLLKEAGFNSANLTILITAMTTAILAIFKQVPIKIFNQIKYFIKSRTMYTIQLQSLINQYITLLNYNQNLYSLVKIDYIKIQ